MFEYLTIKQIKDGFQSKKFSCLELTDYYLARISKHEDLNIYLTVLADRARQNAKEFDARLSKQEVLGDLAGVPVAIKDVLSTKGIKTTAGSKILENYYGSFDATVIKRLQEAGAIFLGKVNCDEFAMGSSNENSFFGPVHNPWAKNRVAGGSSGGSAAAVAADLAPIALGTDTGGSIRQPAAFCGVSGLRPTYGSISRFGLLAMTSSLDQVGPIARTAEDLAIVYNQLIGQDDHDETSFAAQPVKLERQGKRRRIGLPKDCFGFGLSPEIEASIRQAIEVFQFLGHEIVEIDLPMSHYALAVYYVIMSAEVSSNLARYDGVRYGLRLPKTTLEETYFATRTAGLGKEAKRRIMMGTFVLSSGYQEAYYQRARLVQAKIRAEYLKAFANVEAIITPTTPTTAFKIQEKTLDPLAMYLSDIYTVSTNIANLCALSIPSGLATESKLPVGLQIIGAPQAEETILQLAHEFQNETNFHQQYPNL